MLPTLLLAAALSAGPGPAAPALRLEEDWEERAWEEEEERRPRLFLSVWGGEGFLAGGDGRGAPSVAAEVAWAFSKLDVGLAGFGYRGVRDDPSAWARGGLVRLTQRFHTRRGFDAAFTLGFGAARAPDWIGWYQVALGMRVPLGPFFLGAELSFEQLDILRLAGGLGVAF
ncbi:MAG TPA: hypothetical protein VF875_09160 [Anaeromyxobacter sp.]